MRWHIRKKAQGKVFIPWPGTELHFRATAEFIRWEDFDLVCEDPNQKYASLGNGRWSRRIYITTTTLDRAASDT